MSGNLLFLESIAGVAGDMFCASFVDAGLVSAEELQALPRILGLPGVRIEISHPLRATMRTTHIGVTWANEEWKHAIHGHERTTPPHPRGAHGHPPATGADRQWHTPYLEVDGFLAAAPLDAAVTALARKVFRLIAEAEAEAHGVEVDQIMFHEVGAIDSIMDVVMAAYCVNKVAPSGVYATPLKLGRGTVTMAHGTHPVPPPAVARLVVGLPVDSVPPAISRADVELTTPTGAAILKALDPTFTTSMPSGTVRAQGMGSGTMDLGLYPNVFRATVVDNERGHVLPYETDRVVEITCNMDDETPERSAWIMEHLMTLGALDVWLLPITGKKGRAAVSLSVLADEARWTSFADWLLRYSSTFGLRHRVWDRLKLARRFETQTTADGVPLPVKIGMTTTGEILKRKVEFDDVRKVWDGDPGYNPGGRP